MSRLYYGYHASAVSRSLADSEPQSKTKDYFEKIAKLIPSEIIALYVGLIGFVPGAKSLVPEIWLYSLSFATCLILTPFYLGKMADQGKPKIRHMVISTLAFVVWAYTVSGSSVLHDYYSPSLAGMVTLLFTGISGVIPIDD